MVMMTVTPADAKADRMSTTREALLLSRPGKQTGTLQQVSDIAQADAHTDSSVADTERHHGLQPYTSCLACFSHYNMLQ